MDESVKEPVSVQKHGVKTTEFWITLAANMGAAGAVCGLPEDHWFVKVLTVVGALAQNLLYTYFRSKLKTFE